MFGRENVTETLAEVILKDPDWSALPPSVPARIRDLVARCLVRDPRQRLRDIGDARIAIDEALHEPSGCGSGGDDGSGASRLAASRARARRRSRSRACSRRRACSCARARAGAGAGDEWQFEVVPPAGRGRRPEPCPVDRDVAGRTAPRVLGDSGFAWRSSCGRSTRPPSVARPAPNSWASRPPVLLVA